MQIKRKIAESMLGAVVTHAQLTSSGQYLVMVESGHLCVWNLETLTMVAKVEITEAVVDLVLHDEERKLFVVTKQQTRDLPGGQSVLVQNLSLPHATLLYEISFPVLRVKPICVTFEGAYLVTLAWEKKVNLHLHHNIIICCIKDFPLSGQFPLCVPL